MSKFHSYIASASKIISTYSTGKPLAIHIKAFFAADKKFGSRDRRIIASLCYYYYRTSRVFNSNTVEEKILYSLFLCETKSNELLHFFRPDLHEKTGLTPEEKLILLQVNETAIFPYINELGDPIDKHLFPLSFLIQPHIFLRIRPGKSQRVLEKLNYASVSYDLISDECIQLGNHVPADKILKLNNEAVVQDLNSQKVLNYLDVDISFLQADKKVTAWDCCAASGGKSILLYDKLKGNVQLTVSDVRNNILLNLGKRFEEAGMIIHRSLLSDLSVSTGLPDAEKFSIIICDVPCTGSGTWSRSPEQLYYFDKKQIEVYAERQQKIFLNTIPYLLPGGLFFYITCSVFKKENEAMVEFIRENSGLHVLQTQYLKGYEIAADTMFVAVFSTPNL